MINASVSTYGGSGGGIIHATPITPIDMTFRRVSKIAAVVATVQPARQISPEAKLWTHIIGNLFRDIASQGPWMGAHRDAIRAKVDLDEILAILWPGATTERLITAALAEWERAKEKEAAERLAAAVVARKIAPSRMGGSR